MKLPKLKRIYCLYALPDYPGRYKIGITARPVHERVKEVKDSIESETGRTANVKVFLSVPSLFAYRIEQYLHRKFASFSATMPGSGKTEWFLWGNGGLALMWILLTTLGPLNWPPSLAIAIFFIPLPIDFAALLLVALLIEATAVVSVLLFFLAGFYYVLN